MIKQLPYQQKVVTRQPIVATNVVKGNEVRVKDGLCEGKLTIFANSTLAAAH
jgi:hypothetical protein